MVICKTCGGPTEPRDIESLGTGMSPMRTTKTVDWCAKCALEAVLVGRGLPRSYLWAHLDAPELPKRVRRPELVRTALLREPESLLFMGPAGCGKTSLAAAFWRAYEAPGRFVLAWRLSQARARYPLGQGDPPDLVAAIAAPLVVLDDLGGEPGSGVSPVAEVIFERHAEGRPTWITTGLGQAEIVARYDDGIARRIFERAVVIRCDAGGPS